MARRRSAIVHRFSRMKGLPPEEKALMLRIGELVDAAVNNRTPTNPAGDGRRRDRPTIPPPINVLAKTGVRSAVLTWDAIDSSELLNYRVMVLNTDTGVTEVLTTFTNELSYKGRIGGNYSARISSISRRGIQSPIKTVEFFIADDVMLLEGAKNSFNALSTTVSEDIGLIQGHKLFIWGAFTLDKLIAGPSGNSPVVLQLLKSRRDQGIDQATLVQEVTMFPASETAMNLAVDALGGGIFRPTPGVPKPRGASFDPQSVMFTPVSVTAEEAGGTAIFYLKATNRDAENDVTSLSISIWSTFGGAGSQIPSDPFTPEPGIVVNDLKSIDLDCQNDDEYIRGSVEENFRVLGNTWSFAWWFKNTTFQQVSAAVDRQGVVPGSSPNFGRRVNEMQIKWQPSGGDDILEIAMGGKPKVENPGSPEETDFWRRTALSAEFSGTDPNFPVAHDGVWHLMTITYVSGAGIKVYMNTTQLTGSGAVAFADGTDNILQDTQTEQTWVFGTNWASISNNGVYQGIDVSTNAPNTGFDALIHSAGAWTKVLTIDEIVTLFNSGNGAEIHWLTNQGNYESANNLVHYWQFGAVDSSLSLVGRDTGINAFGGDIDTTDAANISDQVTLADVVNDFPGK